jgi:RNase P subunit RPR2
MVGVWCSQCGTKLIHGQTIDLRILMDAVTYCNKCDLSFKIIKVSNGRSKKN